MISHSYKGDFLHFGLFTSASITSVQPRDVVSISVLLEGISLGEKGTEPFKLQGFKTRGGFSFKQSLS